MHAADLQATQQAPDQDSRLPCAHEGPLGTRNSLAPSEEGPQAARGAHSEQARRLLTGSEALPRARRIGSSADYRRILDRGTRRRLAHLDVIWMDNTAGQPRMGLIVPKYQSTAVARNRLRRRLREIWRRFVQPDQPARHEPGNPVVAPARSGVPHSRVPAGDFTSIAAQLPVHPVVLPVHPRSGDPLRRAARRVARREAHRALSPVPSGRIRPGSLTSDFTMRTRLWIAA